MSLIKTFVSSGLFLSRVRKRKATTKTEKCHLERGEGMKWGGKSSEEDQHICTFMLTHVRFG